MSKSANSHETDSLLSRLNGAIKRYNSTGTSTQIGFIDEILQRCATDFFKENSFTNYYFSSPKNESTRKFLLVGEDDTLADDIIYICATSDKFHSPSHRDYMGALMALGIDRRYFGDLIVTQNSKAYFPLWNKADIYRHLFDNFSQCGNAKIYLDIVDKAVFNSLKLNYEETEIIVSSLRADCFVSAISGTSRTVAKKLIEAGDFKISSHPVFDPDTILKQGLEFSIRGLGKYKFDGIIGATRKERFRLKLLKYGNYTERIL